MELSKFKNIKFYAQATVLLLFLTGIIGFMGYQPGADPAGKYSPEGTWNVIEVTGHVNIKVPGGSARCVAKNEN